MRPVIHFAIGLIAGIVGALLARVLDITGLRGVIVSGLCAVVVWMLHPLLALLFLAPLEKRLYRSYVRAYLRCIEPFWITTLRWHLWRNVRRVCQALL